MPEKVYPAPSRTITDVAQDQAHLRSLVYQLARVGLEKDLRRRYELELQKQSSALEQAIAQIESHFPSESQTEILALPGDGTSTAESTDIAIVPANSPVELRCDDSQPQFEVLSPVLDRQWDGRWLPSERQIQDRAETRPGTERRPGWVWWRFQIAVAVIAGLAIYAGGEWIGNVNGLILHDTRHAPTNRVGSELSADKGLVSSSDAARTAQTIDGAPLPRSYGVYAIDRGKLSDLQPLPMRAPDPRIAISAIISSPSQTVLPHGHVEFVVFRRDLMNDAPDRAAVRVVARVMRALTFGPNKEAKFINVDGAWAMRSNAYDMKVGPVSGHPEMIRISPANEEIDLPAGRYALVFKRLAYDFSVAGPITDLKQCLERTDALNAAIYSECPKL